jgi:signal transduction histidine kinase
MGLSHVETEETLERLRHEVGELRASRRRLTLAEDDERRSLERELHGGAQQLLIALAVNIQLARELVERDPSLAAELLEALGHDVQAALDETARLAQRIYPPVIGVGGLGAALRAAAAAANVSAEIDVSATGLSSEVAGAVYFCWLYALEGAAHSRTATIRVSDADDAATFEIGASMPSGIALARIRDRVEALDGTLAVEERADGSTRLLGSLEVSR